VLLLGLAVPIAYIPLVTGTAIHSTWLLLTLALPFTLFRKIEMTPLHWLGLSALGWAAASLLWTENVYDSGEALWHLSILALVFVLGASLPTLRPVFVGLCIGLGISIALVFAWQCGFRPVWQGTIDAPAGLFVTPNALGSALALALVAAIIYQIYWFIPLAVYGLISTGFRTGLVSVGVVGLIALWQRNRPLALTLGVGLVTTIAAIFAIKNTGLASANQRLEYWMATIPSLSWHGHGIGSFFQLYPTLSDWSPSRPEHAYNDFLELTFELGLGVLPLWLMLALTLEAPRAERLILLCFLEQALCFFPLALPVSAFMAALVTGYLARCWAIHCSLWPNRGPTVSRRYSAWKFGGVATRGQALAVESGHSNEAGLCHA